MGDTILNVSHMFSCSASVIFPTPFIQAIDPAQIKGQEEIGGIILTSTAKCILKGASLCNNNRNPNTGAPMPCCLSGNTIWSNTNSTMTIGGNDTLSEKSTCNCSSFGGTISNKIPSTTAKIEKGVLVSIGSAPATNQKSSSTLQGAMQQTDDTPIRQERDNTKEPILKLEENIDKETSANEQIHETLTDEKPKEMQVVLEKDYMLCDYKNCVKALECDYYNAELNIDNNSVILRNNYKNQYNDEYLAYNEKENLGLSLLEPNVFTNAAHHIISGNQCFLEKNGDEYRFGILIRLAAFFKYDINNSDNCILLPTSSKNSIKTLNHELRASSFDFMSVMKAQWHVGGHSYPISTETINHVIAYYKRYPNLYVDTGNSDYCSNYATLVTQELENLQSRKYNRLQCPNKNYMQKVDKFANEMNAISKKIKTQLNDFEESPKKSFPYFVSHYALAYSYNIPIKVKLIVIINNNRGEEAVLFTMKPHQNKKTPPTFFNGGTHPVERTKAFAKFCSNTTYFINSSSCLLNLPFSYFVNVLTLSNLWDEKKPLSDFLQEHCSELLAEISKNENSYQAAVGLASKRWSEIEEGTLCT